MAAPQWFDRKAYFNNKLASMGSGWDSLALAKAFSDAGYDSNDADSMYAHFVNHGNGENVSPNSLFDANQYLTAKASEYLNKANVTPTEVEYVSGLISQSGMTAWDHYNQYGAWETFNGKLLNPSTGFNTELYMEAKLEQMQKVDAAGNWTMEKLIQTFKEGNISPLEHWYEYGYSEGLSYKPATTGDTGETYYLTNGIDRVIGTAGNDYFIAGVGQLQDNDEIYGGGGYDTVEVTLGNSDSHNSELAASPRMSEIDKLVILTQKPTNDSGNNLPVESAIDAGRISDDLRWLQNDNSRAKLVVEDVRTNSNVMTIEWSNSDAGAASNVLELVTNGYRDTGVMRSDNMSYVVHFDNQHLKGNGGIDGTLFIQIMDAKNGEESDMPLMANPYKGLTFQYTSSNGVKEMYTLTLRDADKDLWTGVKATYDSLVTAFKNAISDFEDANPSLKGVLQVEKGAQFTGTAGPSGSPWVYDKGFTINLSATKGEIAFNDKIPGTGWVLDGTSPPNSGMYTIVIEGDETCPLISTNVVLDNVGRVQWYDNAPGCLPDDSIYGSEAGVLEIGAKADRGGVELFDVKVDRGTWMSGMRSTNETLRMITAKNEDTNGDGVNGNTKAEANSEGYGQLFIGRQLAKGTDNIQQLDNLQSWTDKASLLSTDGLVDVKDIIADGFQGNMNLGVSITSGSYYKYLHSVDGSGKINGKFAPNGDFKVYTGEGADVVNMSVEAGIAVDNDFNLVIDTAAGTDFVNFMYHKGSFAANDILESPAPFTAQQMNNQKYLDNVLIKTGTDNDIIKFWGNASGAAAANDGVIRVDAGTGNDKIYVGQNRDDLGKFNSANGTIHQDINAIYVLNTGGLAGTANREVLIDALNGAQSLNNNLQGTEAAIDFAINNPTFIGETLQVKVEFKGFSATANLKLLDTNLVARNVITLTTREINQKIIQAIENDDVLSTVLEAKDGAADSLIIEALYDSLLKDGVPANSDLKISFVVTNNTVALDTNRGGTVAADGTGGTVIDAYNPYFATDLGGANKYEGKDTGTITHNWVEGGLGDDVIVLNAAGTADYHDVLVITGEFGHDKIFNFDGSAAAGPKFDKIDVSAIVSASTGTVAMHAAAAIAPGALEHDASAISSTAIAASETNVVFIKDSASDIYTFFKVEDNGDGTVGGGDTITVLGTMQFESGTAALAVADFLLA